MKYEELHVKNERFNHCPLCGKEAMVNSKKFYDYLVRKDGSACLSVRCDDCNLSVTVHNFGEKVPYDKMVSDLLATWNRLRGDCDETVRTSA